VAEQENVIADESVADNGRPKFVVPVLDEEVPDEPVDIKGRDGVVRHYFITDMGGGKLAKWQKNIAGRSRMNRKGQQLVQNFDGLMPDFISLCLKDEKGDPVPKAMIAGWSNYAQSYLFRKGQEHNGLQDIIDIVSEGKG
jgi:hypothetical protein